MATRYLIKVTLLRSKVVKAEGLDGCVHASKERGTFYHPLRAVQLV